jgi:hypothetical protein|tara:strand:+ start:4452 stop:4712 length:261 start_codon:yes stop_codon:yes gene_type:complete
MGGMENFSINELGGLITVIAGALATILFAVQKSSCTEIGCCGCHCKRDPELIRKAQNDGVTPRPSPKKDDKKPKKEEEDVELDKLV